MSINRFAKRRDKNEPQLIKFAERLGAWLIPIDEPCDWLLFWRQRWELIEIKDPNCEGHADEFTEAQKAFRAEAFRRGARLIVWRTEHDVLNTLNAKVSA
jgi:hypothetical protein